MVQLLLRRAAVSERPDRWRGDRVTLLPFGSVAIPAETTSSSRRVSQRNRDARLRLTMVGSSCRSQRGIRAWFYSESSPSRGTRCN